jgi:iron complex transport system ATP-binding protein
MSLLQTRNLACGYDERTVVADVSLELAPGQLVGIVGPNGAGKSTLIKTLAGLLPARAGEVNLSGKPLAGYAAPELARMRAYMPQQLPADEGWTVREVVRLGRYAHQRGWGLVESAADRQAIDAALEATGLAAIAHQRIERLSGGQRQRAYLARALAQDAPLLLLDEPTAHLDLGHQIEFFKLVRDAMTRRPMAAVAVLHDLNLAAQFCHRLWVVGAGDGEVPEAGKDAWERPGGILADGRPETVLDPDLIERAFGLAVQVRHHPETGLPYLLPSGGLRRSTRGAGRRVHVVAGGGAGERVIPILHRLGFTVSVGAVNMLDSDQALAERLGLATVTEAPFSPLTPRTLEHLGAMLAEASLVVVGDVAWGSGNVDNLRALAELSATPEIWLVDDTPIARRDFSNGEATRLWNALVARGAQPIPLAALLERLRELGTGNLV